MIAAVASENGAPYDSARASTTASSSSVSWQRFSAGDGLGTYELVTRSWSSSVADGGDQTSAAASEVSLVRNGHRVKVYRASAESPVRQTFWTRFHSYPGRANVLLVNPDNPAGSPAASGRLDLGPSVLATCVLEKETLRVFYDNGDDYPVPLQFPVKRCWPSKYGLVLERDTSARPAPKSHSGSNLNPVDPSARPLPVWFGLLHPLDDYSRILTRSKSGSTLREMMTDTHKIVHVAKDPSMCVTFNSHSGQHYVWHVRQSTLDEAIQYEAALLSEDGGLPAGSAATTMTDMTSGTATAASTAPPSAAVTPSGSFSLNTSSSQSNLLTPKTSAVSSPSSGLRALANICRSPNNQTSAMPSSALRHSMLRRRRSVAATVSNGAQSPFAATSTAANSFSAAGLATGSPVGAAALAAALSSAGLPVDGTEQEEELTVSPDVSLCFDHVWTEPAAISRNNFGEAASKAFVARDLHGTTTFLCLLQARAEQLSVIPVETKRRRRKDTVDFIRNVRHCNNNNLDPDEEVEQLFIGAVSHISSGGVLDAAFVERIGMIAVLERSPRSLVLYSGTTKVSCVSFDQSPLSNPPQGLALQSIAHDIAALNLFVQGGASSQPSTPADRPRLMTSSRPPSATVDPSFNESLQFLSPVTSRPGGPGRCARLSAVAAANGAATSSSAETRIVGLRDAVGNQITLEYSNSSFLRLTLPDLKSTELVQLSIDAICSVLGKELSTALRARWYACRNAPGPPCLSPIKEWKLFVQCLLGMMGYRADHFMLIPTDTETPASSSSPLEPVSRAATKKSRKSGNGSDGDWSHVVRSVLHMETGPNLSALLGLDNVARTAAKVKKGSVAAGGSEDDDDDDDTEEDDEAEDHTKLKTAKVTANTTAPLFPSLPHVLCALHFLYEELKLDKAHFDDLQYLAGFLTRLAADLNLHRFVAYYANDFPSICPDQVRDARTNQISSREGERILANATGNSSMTAAVILNANSPPDIFLHLEKILLLPVGGVTEFLSTSPFSLAPEFAQRTRDLTLCFGAIKSLPTTMLDKHHFCTSDAVREVLAMASSASDTLSKPERLIKCLSRMGYDRRRIETLPEGIALVANLAAFACRQATTGGSANLDASENALIGRPDLSLTLSRAKTAPAAGWTSSASSSSSSAAYSGGVGGDGMEELTSSRVAQLRWPNDKRLGEVRDMLASAAPVPIRVVQRHEMSDHEFVEEQERCLQMICVRTTALPIGRGSVTLHTGAPLITDPVHVPKLNLTGRAAPRGTVVEMEHIDVVPNMDRWPLFNNGVAAGLQISPDCGAAAVIDSTWITFNRPPDSAANFNATIEHAGFLMGLGLSGHLSKLGRLESFDYMIKGNELISVGVLIGMAASKKGSMDLVATKKVSTQLAALLPSSATELPISHTTQIAGLVALGLLYQGTGHRHMAEVCLFELGRLPGPEAENCSDRESYSLSAGLALGMITFGQGPSLTSGSLSDLELPDILHYHMIGGPRSAVAQKLKKTVGAAAVGSGGGGVAGIVGGGPGGGGTGGGGGSAGYQGLNYAQLRCLLRVPLDNTRIC